MLTTIQVTWLGPAGRPSFRLDFVYTVIMSNSIISVNEKRGRGRPATGVDPAVSARLPVGTLKLLDEWAKKWNLTRSQAISRLVVAGLKGKR